MTNVLFVVLTLYDDDMCLEENSVISLTGNHITVVMPELYGYAQWFLEPSLPR